MGVAAGCAARRPSSETEMYGYNTQGIAQVSALGSSEASAPQRFKCINIMGDSNGGSATVRSKGCVLSREGPFSEVPVYVYIPVREVRDIGKKTRQDRDGA